MKKILEKDVKRAIKNLLDGLRIWNFPLLAGLGCYPGLPDRIAIYKGMVFAIEIKAPNGKQSEKQATFQERWEYHYKKTYVLAKSVDDVIEALGLRIRFF